MLELLRSLGLPEVASAHGDKIDHVIVLTHWLMFLLAVFWGAYFIYVIFRFSAKSNPKADHAGMRSHFSKYIEIAVVLFEAIILIGFSIPFWAAEVDAMPDESDVGQEVRVIAQQFGWNIHYPGADRKFGKTSAELVDESDNPIGLDREDPNAADDLFTFNDLHLPVNEKALIHISSKDVIHSFSLPIMRVKQDAIPGMQIPVNFTPIQTGKSQIACAQLCGSGHSSMVGNLTVETREEFDAWLVAKKAELDEEMEDEEDEEEEE